MTFNSHCAVTARSAAAQLLDWCCPVCFEFPSFSVLLVPMFFLFLPFHHHQQSKVTLSQPLASAPFICRWCWSLSHHCLSLKSGRTILRSAVALVAPCSLFLHCFFSSTTQSLTVFCTSNENRWASLSHSEYPLFFFSTVSTPKVTWTKWRPILMH